MLNTLLNTQVSSLNLTTKGRCYSEAPFTSGKMKAQRGEVTCPRSHSFQVAKLGFECGEKDGTSYFTNVSIVGQA